MLDDVSDLVLLIENLGRLRTHVESVRIGSRTARDDLATVLHILVGGDGRDDGYGLILRAFDQVDLGPPLATAWGYDVSDTIDGEPVLLALRGTPIEGPTTTLGNRLSETCLRFAVPGTEPAANWCFLDLIKKVRNKFGSHVDRKPPKWLEELRFYPAGDTDAITYLLWRAAEEVLSSVTSALIASSHDVEPFQPTNRYLNGLDLTQAYVVGRLQEHLDVRAHLRCASWTSASRRAVIGGRFGESPFVFGLEADGRLVLTTGTNGSAVADLLRVFVTSGLPKVGRNDLCPCGSGRKYKFCHDR
jgi:hypothetical protein